jgi:hypothetical protein
VLFSDRGTKIFAVKQLIKNKKNLKRFSYFVVCSISDFFAAMNLGRNLPAVIVIVGVLIIEVQYRYHSLSGRVVGHLAEWLERQAANAVVATVLGSITASSDTVESEGPQMKQCFVQKNPKKSIKTPPHKKKSSSFIYSHNK